MASIQFNISKGREVQFYDNVDTNNPANSALILIILETGSVNGLNGLIDFDTVAAVLAGGYTEASNSSRKTLTDADLSAWSPDDTNNRILLTLPLQTYTAPAVGDNWDIVIVAYDNDTTGGTDANLVPITASELRTNAGIAIVPDGVNDVFVDFSTGWVAAV